MKKGNAITLYLLGLVIGFDQNHVVSLLKKISNSKAAAS